jgi:pimeloyl-ACP methyl ester carboxylesterase
MIATSVPYPQDCPCIQLARTARHLMVMSFKHNTAKVSTGIEVHYVEAGDPSDPCVVLIHGQVYPRRDQVDPEKGTTELTFQKLYIAWYQSNSYPQTWYMYRHVIADIAKSGYHVIAPDYRGAGQTSLSPTQDDKEDTGYDKFSMAADLHALYKEVLGVDKAFIVGIDIGSMVATALALRYREDVIGLFASGERRSEILPA